MQISMPGVAAQMPPTTVTQCVTKEQVSDPTKAFPQAQGRGGASNGCKVADYKVDGNNVTFSMACDAPQSLTMKGKLMYGVDTYNGTIHVAVDRGGQPTSMTMNYSAKRLGDCVKVGSGHAHVAYLSSEIVAVDAALAAWSPAGAAQERDRAKVPEKYTWNLADIYPTEAAWRAAKDALAADIPELAPFKGKLATSPAALADALEQSSALDKDASRLTTYASLLADQDSRDAAHQGMKQEMEQLDATLGARRGRSSSRKILAMPTGTVEAFIAAEPRLERLPFLAARTSSAARAHTLSEGEEKLLAGAGPLASAPSDTYNILANADFPYPTRDARARKDRGKIDQAALRRSARAPESRGSREGHVRIFQRARQVQQHVRDDDERRSAEGEVLRRTRGTTGRTSNRSSTPKNIPVVGLHAARRRREAQPRHVSSISRRCASG